MKAVLVVNPAAGKRTDVRIGEIEATLEQGGVTLLPGPDGHHFGIEQLPDAMDRAANEGADAIIAYGGDGTVRAVAEAVLGSSRALGIIPGGTMNMLARDLGVPLDPKQAAQALGTGQTRSIDVGLVGEDIFLCASVLGAPARLARHREARRRSWRLAFDMARAAYASVRRYPRRRYRLMIDGAEVMIRTRALTVANNAFDSGFTETVNRSRLDAGELTVHIMKDAGLYRFARAMFAFYAGNLQDEPTLDSRTAHVVTVEGEAQSLRVMNDGEVQLMPSPLRYGIRPRALNVLVPADSVVLAREASTAGSEGSGQGSIGPGAFGSGHAGPKDAVS